MQEIPSALRRLAAIAIDAAILGVIGFSLGHLFEAQLVRMGPETRLIGFVIAGIYFILFEALAGSASPGKRLMEMKVVTTDGRAPGLGRIAGRFAFLYVPFYLNGLRFPEWLPSAVQFPLSILVFAIIVIGCLQAMWFVLFDKQSRRGVHERWTDTRVVFDYQRVPEPGSVAPRWLVPGFVAVTAVILSGYAFLFRGIGETKVLGNVQRWAAPIAAQYPDQYAGMSVFTLRPVGSPEKTRLVVSFRYTERLDETVLSETSREVASLLHPFGPEVPAEVVLVGVYSYDIGIWSFKEQKTANIKLVWK